MKKGKKEGRPNIFHFKTEFYGSHFNYYNPGISITLPYITLHGLFFEEGMKPKQTRDKQIVTEHWRI